MKKISSTVITILSIFTMSSACAIGPVNGILFTKNKFAGEFNASNNVNSVKTAKRCQHLILGLISFGNAGAGYVAYMGKIERISTIDHSTVNVLQIVYSNYCTIVSGE